MNKRSTWALPYFIFLVLFVVLPLVMIVIYALQDGSGHFTLQNITKFFTDKDALSTFALSIEVAIENTLLCILIGYPAAYILADNPGMGIMDVIKASWNMMKGHKWELFVLDLSFIGWILLDILTLGILGLFYVNPYIFSTHAAFYEALKAETNVLPELPETPVEA